MNDGGPRRDGAEEDAESVARFLRAHPDFLADRPELYRSLTPPRRVHGEALADHMQARIEAVRDDLARLERQLAEAAEAGRAGASIATAVRQAVIALIRAGDPIETVTQEWPALLNLACAALLAESDPFAAPSPGVRPLPAGTVARLMGRGREAIVRAEPAEAKLLHGEAAPLVTRDALIRVELPGGSPAILALGARIPGALPLRQSAATLGFLGRAVGAALAARA